MKQLYTYTYKDGRDLFTEVVGSLALALRFAREDKHLKRVPVRIVANDGREVYNRSQLRDFTRGGR